MITEPRFSWNSFNLDTTIFIFYVISVKCLILRLISCCCEFDNNYFGYICTECGK